MSKFRIAIVGAGVIGRQHAKVVSELSDQLELAAVIDHKPDKAKALVAEYGGASFGTLTEVLAGTGVDIVAVCTPTGVHAEVAIEALDAGKHVIIEKPAEVTLKKIDRIIEAQKRANTFVTVISQHRFDPSTKVVLAAIAAGKLGRLTSGIASIGWWRGSVLL